MFTCLGRGTFWYEGEEGVESNIINKTLPGCPVIGFFGGGEIGQNFMPGNLSNSAVGISQLLITDQHFLKFLIKLIMMNNSFNFFYRICPSRFNFILEKFPRDMSRKQKLT